MSGLDTLVDDCKARFLEILEPADEGLVDDLVHHVFEHDTVLPLETVIDALVHRGHPPACLFQGLVACESLHLAALLPDMLEQLPADQRTEVQELLDHYSGMQARWQQILGESYAGEIKDLRRQIGQRGERQLEERTKNLWLNSGRIRLFNYFRELMVVGATHVDSLEDYYVTVHITPQLERVFAADERMRFAYTFSTRQEIIHRLEVHSCKGDLLTLRIAGLIYHPQAARRQVRVAGYDEIFVELSQERRPLGSGLMMDLSQTGLGLYYDRPLNLGLGESVQVVAEVRGQAFKTDARVAWIFVDGRETRLGLELSELSEEERKAMHGIVLSYEQDIIQKLRELGTPESLSS